MVLTYIEALIISYFNLCFNERIKTYFCFKDILNNALYIICFF